MATMWRASRLAAGQLQRSNWLLKARQKILGTEEFRRRRRRRRRRWLRRRGGRVIFLLIICIISILLVPRIVIAQSRVSGIGEARKRKRSGEQRSNPARIRSYRRLRESGMEGCAEG